MSDVQTVNFEFTVEEANVVLAGLGELPAKVSLPLINKIQKAAQSQLKDVEAIQPEIVTE